MDSAYFSTPVTFAAGQSVSDVADLSTFVAFSLAVPAGFVGTTLTVVASETSDQGPFVSVYDDTGAEVTLTVAASRIVSVDAAGGKSAPLRFVKFRAGTTASPVTQTGGAVLTLLGKR